MSEPSLAPMSSPADGSPGWRVIVPSRQIAAAIAADEGGDVQSADHGTWAVLIRRAALRVTAIDADTGALRCILRTAPDTEPIPS